MSTTRHFILVTTVTLTMLVFSILVVVWFTTPDPPKPIVKNTRDWCPYFRAC